jgi:hypothetical protein
VTDFPDWLPPAAQALEDYFGLSTQIAALIATGSPTGAPGGVPLLANPLELYNFNGSSSFGQGVTQTATNINGQTTTPVGLYMMYEISAEIHTVSAPVNPICTITMNWTIDSGGLYTCYREQWNVFTGTSPGVQIAGSGPCYGPYLTVSVTNWDTGAMLIDGIGIVVHSRPYFAGSSDWRTYYNGTTMPSPYSLGLINAPGSGKGGENFDGTAGLAYQLSLAANSDTYYLCGLYNGQIDFNCSNLPAGVSVNPVIAIPINGHHLSIGGTLVGAGAAAFGSWQMPRHQLALEVKNTNGAASVVSFLLQETGRAF